MLWITKTTRRKKPSEVVQHCASFSLRFRRSAPYTLRTRQRRMVGGFGVALLGLCEEESHTDTLHVQTSALCPSTNTTTNTTATLTTGTSATAANTTPQSSSSTTAKKEADATATTTPTAKTTTTDDDENGDVLGTHYRGPHTDCLMYIFFGVCT